MNFLRYDAAEKILLEIGTRCTAVDDLMQGLSELQMDGKGEFDVTNFLLSRRLDFFDTRGPRRRVAR